MKMHWSCMALAIAFGSPAALARDVAYDFVVCSHARLDLFESSADVVAFGAEEWGVVASSTTKEWENATSHCMGFIRMAAGKPVGKGICKWANAGGDTAVGEWEYPAAGGEPSWTWVSGNGNLTGIRGTGAFRLLGNGRPADAGTSQGCRRDWGTYALP